MKTYSYIGSRRRDEVTQEKKNLSFELPHKRSLTRAGNEFARKATEGTRKLM
jgi:hypothetical protein